MTYPIPEYEKIIYVDSLVRTETDQSNHNFLELMFKTYNSLWDYFRDNAFIVLNRRIEGCDGSFALDEQVGITPEDIAIRFSYRINWDGVRYTIKNKIDEMNIKVCSFKTPIETTCRTLEDLIRESWRR